MCGRVGLAYSWKQLWELFNLSSPVPEEGIRVLNLGPSWKSGDQVHWSRVPVIRATPEAREAAGLVWPLIPVWLKGELPKFSTANCRSEAGVPFSETVKKKPTFRGAWKHQRRCLVPVSWFYEWDQRSKPKQPWRILPRNGDFLVMAGLWERSPLPDGSDLESFTIVTTQPNQLLTDIGHHRAPVMIDPDDWDTWLSGEPTDAESLIRPPADDLMRAHQVTTRVNNPGYQEEDLLEDLEGKAQKG
jgi:putative SOS response-associated peptidase YedK